MSTLQKIMKVKMSNFTTDDSTTHGVTCVTSVSEKDFTADDITNNKEIDAKSYCGVITFCLQVAQRPVFEVEGSVVMIRTIWRIRIILKGSF